MYQKPEVIREIQNNYILQDQIGSGSFGVVYRAFRKIDETPVAIKIVDMDRIDQNAQIYMLNESNLLQQCNHKNILKVYESKKIYNTFLMISELCNMDLYQVIQQYHQINEMDALIIFYQILQALNYLHEERRIIHRDLKTENVMIKIRPNCKKVLSQLTLSEIIQNSDIKLIDFGVSKQITYKQYTHTMVGSPFTMAPEVMNLKPYSFKSDLYSTGCILFEMLTGQIFNNDFSLLKNYNVQKCEKIVRSLLDHDFDKRPSISDILEEQNFKEIILDFEKKQLKQNHISKIIIINQPQNQQQQLQRSTLKSVAKQPSSNETNTDNINSNEESHKSHLNSTSLFQKSQSNISKIRIVTLQKFPEESNQDQKCCQFQEEESKFTQEYSNIKLDRNENNDNGLQKQFLNIVPGQPYEQKTSNVTKTYNINSNEESQKPHLNSTSLSKIRIVTLQKFPEESNKNQKFCQFQEEESKIIQEYSNIKSERIENNDKSLQIFQPNTSIIKGKLTEINSTENILFQMEQRYAQIQVLYLLIQQLPGYMLDQLKTQLINLVEIFLNDYYREVHESELQEDLHYCVLQIKLTLEETETKKFTINQNLQELQEDIKSLLEILLKQSQRYTNQEWQSINIIIQFLISSFNGNSIELNVIDDILKEYRQNMTTKKQSSFQILKQKYDDLKNEFIFKILTKTQQNAKQII